MKISQSINVSSESIAEVSDEVRSAACSSVALDGGLFSTLWRNNTVDYFVRLEQAPSSRLFLLSSGLSPSSQILGCETKTSRTHEADGEDGETRTSSG